MAKKSSYRPTEAEFFRVLKPFKQKLKGMLLEGEKIHLSITGTSSRLRVTLKTKDED